MSEQNKSDPNQNPDPTHAPGPDTSTAWPLEADRLAIQSPLLECLVLIAGHYGRRTSVNALSSGLPIPKSGMTPALLIRAAERADLTARLTERPLDAIALSPNLPCLLTLEGMQACILWSVSEDRKSFTVQFAETAEEKQTLPIEVLERLYTGYAFFIRPIARLDDRAGPQAPDNVRHWFWSELWAHRKIYKEVALAAVMVNMFALASSLYIMNVYDRVIPNSAYETLWMLSVGVVIVYIFDFVLRNLRAWFLDHAGRKADVKISSRLFQQLMGMTMEARPASAGVMASHMKEFETLRDFFTSATMAALVDLPFTFLFILLIAVIGGPIAFVPLIAVPIVLGMGWIMQGPMQKVIKESMHESALKNALLFETITGLETVKLHAAEGHTQRRWEELTDRAARTSVKSRRLSALALNIAVFVQQLVSAGVVIVGVFLIADAQISMGALIACVILTGRAIAPLAQVAGLLTRLNQTREALIQLDDLMKKPVERPTGKHFISMPQIKGHIDIQEVVFKYPGQSIPALKGVSCTINPGERIGLIGAVGSGKTTLGRLLMNLFQPESGSVQIDGTDVRQIDPGDLRRSIGVVQQGAQLFYGSVRDNITLGHEMAPDRAVVQAAEMAGVMEFLRDSQAGLDTPIGERGEALSGGQRQAVAVARALLYNPPILLLDEPTASMDPASENRLRRRLETLSQGKTVLLITHKGSMLPLVDKLILMDRGKLIAFGPRDEIIAKLQARQYGTQAEQS